MCRIVLHKVLVCYYYGSWIKSRVYINKERIKSGTDEDEDEDDASLLFIGCLCVSKSSIVNADTRKPFSHVAELCVSQPLQTVINIISVDRATFYYTFQFHSQQADSRPGRPTNPSSSSSSSGYPLGVIMIYKDC